MKVVSCALAGTRAKVSRAGIPGLAVLLGLAALALPMTAMAARPYAISYIFLDSQDNIIGQSIGYCNNVDKHAGVVDFSDPYTITQQVPCDLTKPQVVGMTGFHSATGLTVDYYCNAQHPVGTPFAGAPGCDGDMPPQDTNLGPFTSGLGP